MLKYRNILIASKYIKSEGIKQCILNWDQKSCSYECLPHRIRPPTRIARFKIASFISTLSHGLVMEARRNLATLKLTNWC